MAVGRYQGLLEAIETGRQLDIPVQIAHISNAFIMNQPHSDEMEEAMVRSTLDILDQATAEGLDVTFDIIPNVTGPFNQPGLLFAFTKWVMLSGSKEQFVENLKMKEFRAELRSAITSGRFTLMMLNPATDPYWGNRTTILRCKNKDYEGKTANQIGQSNGTDAIEALFDVLVEDPDTQYQNMVDVRTTAAGIPVFLKHPGAMIGLDHAATGPDTQLDHPYPDFDLQHPNNYGGFPHFITTYVRDKGTLSLEDAISKTSYLPAKKLGIQDRGVIRAGAYADIVVFDLENLENRSTFLDPHHAPAGIEHVLVNGEVVYEALAATGRMPGKVLRHRG